MVVTEGKVGGRGVLKNLKEMSRVIKMYFKCTGLEPPPKPHTPYPDEAKVRSSNLRLYRPYCVHNQRQVLVGSAI